MMTSSEVALRIADTWDGKKKLRRVFIALIAPRNFTATSGLSFSFIVLSEQCQGLLNILILWILAGFRDAELNAMSSVLLFT